MGSTASLNENETPIRTYVETKSAGDYVFEKIVDTKSGEVKGAYYKNESNLSQNDFMKLLKKDKCASALRCSPFDTVKGIEMEARLHVFTGFSRIDCKVEGNYRSPVKLYFFDKAVVISHDHFIAHCTTCKVQSAHCHCVNETYECDQGPTVMLDKFPKIPSTKERIIHYSDIGGLKRQSSSSDTHPFNLIIRFFDSDDEIRRVEDISLDFRCKATRTKYFNLLVQKCPQLTPDKPKKKAAQKLLEAEVRRSR